MNGLTEGMTEWLGFYITVCIYQYRILKLLVLEEVWEDDLGPSLYYNNEETQAQESQAHVSEVGVKAAVQGQNSYFYRSLFLWESTGVYSSSLFTWVTPWGNVQ